MTFLILQSQRVVPQLMPNPEFKEELEEWDGDTHSLFP